MDNIVLSNVDCLEYIKTIPDKSVDLILTDPPYNIAQYSTGNIPLPGRSAVNNDLGEWGNGMRSLTQNLIRSNILYGIKPILCLKYSEMAS